MRSSRLTFLIGLSLSAAIHATLIWQLPRWADGGRVAAETPPKYKVAPPGTLPDPPPVRTETPLGEAKGVGDAINSSPGDEPQSAPLSRPDQAMWTRDPTGNGPGERPAPPPKPLTAAVVTPPPAAVPTPPPTKFPAFKKTPPPQPKAPQKETPKDAPPPQQQPRQPMPERPPQKPQDAADPTPPGGRPLPHSDQDSDAFAKEVTVEFKRGQVVAAPGRQIKFTRPRLNIASMVESAEIMLPAKMRLRVSVTPQGSARNVVVVRSTGSSSIDRAFLLAAYESWFEPAKDRAGRPVADEFEFNIAIE